MEAERRRGGRGELSSRGCKSWGDNVAFERVASFWAARTMERRILIFQIKGKFEIPTTFTKPLCFSRSFFFLSLLQFLVFHSLQRPLSFPSIFFSSIHIPLLPPPLPLPRLGYLNFSN